ncbi:hypothetical protein FEF65_06625 [Mariprofundus erugo]|uniref:Uncharacterized protein n=1 Tax=Mariprofundus erugo TaxID=2528639 RepID=A0A5R9GWX2_9PROT|nr:hypothetical protein [Mariprofundus erugo]TLS67584.1 hypothetical protein FEF65_06625 [Mariprofundus erugo]
MIAPRHQISRASVLSAGKAYATAFTLIALSIVLSGMFFLLVGNSTIMSSYYALTALAIGSLLIWISYGFWQLKAWAYKWTAIVCGVVVLIDVMRIANGTTVANVLTMLWAIGTFLFLMKRKTRILFGFITLAEDERQHESGRDFDIESLRNDLQHLSVAGVLKFCARWLRRVLWALTHPGSVIHDFNIKIIRMIAFFVAIVGLLIFGIGNQKTNMNNGLISNWTVDFVLLECIAYGFLRQKTWAFKATKAACILLILITLNLALFGRAPVQNPMEIKSVVAIIFLCLAGTLIFLGRRETRILYGIPVPSESEKMIRAEYQDSVPRPAGVMGWLQATEFWQRMIVRALKRQESKNIYILILIATSMISLHNYQYKYADPDFGTDGQAGGGTHGGISRGKKS